MIRVSQHYGLNGPLPFLDVDVDGDIPFFLDPSAIRNANDAWAARAHRVLVDFFAEVLRLRTSAAPGDAATGQALLDHLHEPNETRLGLSRAHAAGHGVGAGLGAGLWGVLGHSVFARAAAARRIEDLPLFVDGVGDDLISDLSTRVVFEVLADFTDAMCQRYPALSAGAATEHTTVWEPGSRTWVPKALTLPCAFGRQLLLVPKEWVFWRMAMDHEQFYNRFGTNTVQDERTTIDAQGRMQRPSKAELHEEFPRHKELSASQTVKCFDQGRDLVEDYRAFVDKDFEPLDDDEIERRRPC